VQVRGTLMRLPLRTPASAAANSSLSSACWDVRTQRQDIAQQLSAFCAAAQHSLLLLGRLRRVSVQVVGVPALDEGRLCSLWQAEVAVPDAEGLRPGACLLLADQLCWRAASNVPVPVDGLDW